MDLEAVAAYQDAGATGVSTQLPLFSWGKMEDVDG